MDDYFEIAIALTAIIVSLVGAIIKRYKKETGNKTEPIQGTEHPESQTIIQDNNYDEIYETKSFETPIYLAEQFDNQSKTAVDTIQHKKTKQTNIVENKANKRFNIRKAVIFSSIIHRPYD